MKLHLIQHLKLLAHALVILFHRKPIKKVYTLDDLLVGITPENRHGEWDMGAAVGNEVW